MAPRAYLPSKLRLRNVGTVTETNLLKTPKSPPPPCAPPQYGGTSCRRTFPTERRHLYSRRAFASRPLYDMSVREGSVRAGEGLVSACGLPIQASSNTSPPRSHYLFIIARSNKCASHSVTLHHTSGRSNAGPKKKKKGKEGKVTPSFPAAIFSSFIGGQNAR